MASCSIYCPFIKNIKSFSEVAVISLGAEAVTALKLAVDTPDIEFDVLTKFLSTDEEKNGRTPIISKFVRFENPTDFENNVNVKGEVKPRLPPQRFLA